MVRLILTKIILHHDPLRPDDNAILNYLFTYLDCIRWCRRVFRRFC